VSDCKRKAHMESGIAAAFLPESDEEEKLLGKTSLSLYKTRKMEYDLFCITMDKNDGTEANDS